MAAEEVLLRRPLRRPGDQTPAAKLLATEPRGLRSAARQDLLRDRHRSAQHAQVSGHGAVARAARPFAGQLSARRVDACPVSCIATRRSLFDGIDTTIAGLAQFAGARPPRGARGSAWRAIETAVQNCAAAVRRRSARRDVPAARGRPARRPRAARAASRPCRSTRLARYEIDFRLAAERARISGRPSCSPTACASKRWPTTAWWCRASRSGVGGRRQPRRGRRDRQAGRTSSGFDGAAPCTLTAPSAASGRGGGGAGRGGAAAARRRHQSRRSKKDQAGAASMTLTVPDDRA